MKQFSLEEYLKNPSRTVVTRNGKSVRIVCMDFNNESYPIIGEVQGETTPLTFSKEGEFCRNNCCNNDLFFAPEKHEGWMNIYKHNDGHYEGDGNIYNTEEECKANQASCYRYQYLTTIKIEWEE